MADVTLSAADILALAIKKRDELNVFIRLLTNVLQGRDIVEDMPERAA